MSKAILKHHMSLLERLTGEPLGERAVDCLACGKCISRCSWYDEAGGPNPRQLVRMAVLGLEEQLASSDMLWTCMCCNRCATSCPMGIDIGNLVRLARGLPGAAHQIPEDFKRGINFRLTVGNVNGVEKEDYVDTLEWLAEEWQAEEENAAIPIDAPDCEYVYLPNPREVDQIPMHLLAMCRLLAASGQSWTLCSDLSDVTNWGYFIADDEAGAQIAKQVVDAMGKLGGKTLVLSECGHGYIVLKEFAERWLGRPLPFRVANIVEVVLENVEAGRIKLDKNATPEAVVYHDPCKIGRGCKLYEQPRRLLAHVCPEVQDLWPNRKHSICCGGGGGFLQDSKSIEKRMHSGKSKADQMAQASAKIVATSCLSCHRQLGELSHHYKLGKDVTTVASLAAKALVKG